MNNNKKIEDTEQKYGTGKNSKYSTVIPDSRIKSVPVKAKNRLLDKYLRIKAAMAGEQIQQSRRRIGF